MNVSLLVLLAISILMIGVVLYLFGGRLIAPIRGETVGVEITESGENRIVSETLFRSLYAEIEALDAKMNVRFSGVRGLQTCEGLIATRANKVGEYNAASESELRGKWRPSDLPRRIDNLTGPVPCQG